MRSKTAESLVSALVILLVALLLLLARGDTHGDLGSRTVATTADTLGRADEGGATGPPGSSGSPRSDLQGPELRGKAGD